MRRYVKWTKALPTHIVNNTATLGHSAYWTKAPGTVGSLFGLVWYVLLFWSLSPMAYLVILVATIYGAIAICGEAEIRMQKRDPGVIILDEFVAVPLCFFGIPISQTSSPWLYLLIGFALFRFFDIKKPLGINQLQKYEGGVGVVADDLGAAVATCISLHLLIHVFSRVL